MMLHALLVHALSSLDEEEGIRDSQILVQSSGIDTIFKYYRNPQDDEENIDAILSDNDAGIKNRLEAEGDESSDSEEVRNFMFSGLVCVCACVHVCVSGIDWQLMRQR